ncbi:T9SS type A sorting domain-containing protein [Bacteroidota bacterium]
MKLVSKILFLLIVNASVALGQVTVTTASGGVNLARSKAVNGSAPAFTPLGDIVIDEGSSTDFSSSGTLIFSTPSNWQFNASASITVDVTTSGSPKIAVSVHDVSSGSITFEITVDATNKSETVTISGIEVQPIDGNITPAEGSILPSGTADINGITEGVTNIGSVSTDPISPMPVELVSFTAIPEGSIIHLRWSTATEVNNYGFDVERSIHNGIWEAIGFVEGNGNSYSPKQYEFIDDLSGLQEMPGLDSLNYRLKQIDTDGSYKFYNLGDSDDLNTFTNINDDIVPDKIELFQNYPNPFNPTTNINYSLSKDGYVSLKVYDILGKEVATLVNEDNYAGQHTVSFDGSNLSSGIYIYTLQTNSKAVTQKMLLIK